MTKPSERTLPKQTKVYIAVCFLLFLIAILTCDKTTDWPRLTLTRFLNRIEDIQIQGWQLTSGKLWCTPCNWCAILKDEQERLKSVANSFVLTQYSSPKKGKIRKEKCNDLNKLYFIIFKREKQSGMSMFISLNPTEPQMEVATLNF